MVENGTNSSNKAIGKPIDQSDVKAIMSDPNLGAKGYLGTTLVNYLHILGASLTTAMAFDTMDRVYNPRALQNPNGIKLHPQEFHIYGSDGVKADTSVLLKNDEFRAVRDLRELDGTDTPTLTKNPDIAGKSHDRSISMLGRYSNYLFNNYLPYLQQASQNLTSSRQNKSMVNYFDSLTDRLSKEHEVINYRHSFAKQFDKGHLPKEYAPLDLSLESANVPEKISAYKSIELLAYQILANQHAYQGLQTENNSTSYLAVNGKSKLRISEGYIQDENYLVGIGYLTLSIANQYEELQRYTLMIKYNDEKSRKVSVDKAITEGLDELLGELSEKETISTEDVIHLITKILEKRKETDENLALTEVQLKLFEKSLKEQLKVESHDNTKSMILMLELEKSLKLKQLIVKRKPENKDSQFPAEDKKEVRYNYLPSYLGSISDYIKKLEKKRKDFTHLAPFKVVHKFPVNMMGGVLGFTYLGENFMGIRDDLYGPELHEVELHEAIHTPDEYETRVITKWMLDNETKYH